MRIALFSLLVLFGACATYKPYYKGEKLEPDNNSGQLTRSIFLLSGASQTKDNSSLFNLENRLAIQGYDPVAYFTSGKAKEGKRELSTTYADVVYYFSSAANKIAFIKNPEKYEAQYGGWCAYAMGSDGSKVKVDPETFKIIDGKLYLYYNFFFNNTLKSRNEDEARLKAQADKNWRLLGGTNH